jgi:quinol monooxygenase YgiN
MSQPVVVVAFIEAQPEHTAAVEAALRTAVEAVRPEPGCERYDLHQDPSAPHRFVMLEQWHDDASLERHGAAPGLSALRAALDGRATLTVHRLAQLM